MAKDNLQREPELGLENLCLENLAKEVLMEDDGTGSEIDLKQATTWLASLPKNDQLSLLVNAGGGLVAEADVEKARSILRTMKKVGDAVGTSPSSTAASAPATTTSTSTAG